MSDFPIWEIRLKSPDYPSVLQRLISPPPVIYGRGDISLLTGCRVDRTVGFAGARRCSSYGAVVTGTLARDLAELGYTIVANLSLGICSAALHSALASTEGRGQIITCPSLRPVGSLWQLAETNLERGGCVISATSPETDVNPQVFKKTARLPYALAGITILPEFRLKSQVDFAVRAASLQALELGAIPGPTTSMLSQGPNRLLCREYAACITSADDVVAALGRVSASSPFAACA